MHTDFFNSAQSVVTYAATVTEVILLVRLAWLGLLRDFKIFVAFLLYDVVRTATLMRLDYHSYGYEWVWAISSPVWTLLLAGAAYELSRGVVQPIPQETGNRKAALYGFLLGIAAAGLLSMLSHPEAILRSAVLFTNITRRCILSGCILGILVQGAYLTIGSAQFFQNWRMHRRTLLTFLTAIVIASFVGASNNRQLVDWVNLLRGITLFGCLCVWIARLRPAVEDVWSTLEKPDIADAVVAEILAYYREGRHQRRVNNISDDWI